MWAKAQGSSKVIAGQVTQGTAVYLPSGFTPGQCQISTAQAHWRDAGSWGMSQSSADGPYTLGSSYYYIMRIWNEVYGYEAWYQIGYTISCS